MAFAQGARSRLVMVPEVTFGTTPMTPTMKSLPFNTHSLNLRKTMIESQEIRSDRQVAVARHGNISVEGEMEAEFRPSDYDDLLEGAFFGDFNTAGILKLGTTFKSFSIEDGALDINQYRLFAGMAVNTFNLNVVPDQIVTSRFGFMGKNMTQSGSPADASPDANISNEPFDAFSGSIEEGGSPIAIVSALELNIENGLDPAFVIGSNTTPQMQYGRGRVSGQITVYYQDAAMLNKFKNETESSLRFTLASTATGDSYEFYLPRIKYGGADVGLDNEQSRLITMPFIGLLDDSVENTSLVLTKS